MRTEVVEALDIYTIRKQRQQFFVNEGCFRPKDFAATPLADTILEEAGVLDEYLKEYRKDDEKAAFWRDVLDASVERAKTLHHAALVSKLEYGDSIENELSDLENIVEKFRPLRDWETGEEFLINVETMYITDLNVSTWRGALTKTMEGMFAQVPIAEIVYDPYNIKAMDISEREGVKIRRVNTYTPPAWRFHPDPRNTTIPILFDRVLNHLFTKDMKEYILDWMHFALVSRNETYLVLNGSKGIGKGVFCSICTCVLGKKHFAKADRNFLNSPFDSILKDNRLIFLDECKTTKENHTVLKDMINVLQNVHKKHHDANKTIKTYNSFIINNNDITDMYIEHDDRRFSVADFKTGKDLDTEFVNDLGTLLKEIDKDDSPTIRQMGYFLLRRKPNHPLNHPYKGDRFWEVVRSSLSEWKKFLLDKAEEGGETYRITELRKKFQEAHGQRAAFPTNFDKFNHFLTTFRRRDGKRIGDVVKHGKNIHFEVAQHLHQTEEKETPVIDIDEDPDLL